MNVKALFWDAMNLQSVDWQRCAYLFDISTSHREVNLRDTCFDLDFQANLHYLNKILETLNKTFLSTMTCKF